MKKIWKSYLMAGILSISLGIQAFAGVWKNDSAGYWYLNDDGTYPVSSWQWIDGNDDGIEERYYFNGQGYLLVNALTPDGCTVDANGAWTVDGVVQARRVFQEYSDPIQAYVPSEQAPDGQAQAGAVQNGQAEEGQQLSGSGQSGISNVPYDGYTIIVNTNTKKYHVPGCRSVKAMKQSNMGYASDVSYVEALGYVPCKNCH